MTYFNRRALQMSLIVFLAILVNHFFSFSKEYWLVLTAFLASFTTIGTPIKQALIYFLVIVASILTAFLLWHLSKMSLLCSVLLIIYVLSGGLLLTDNFHFNKFSYFLTLFALLLLLATFTMTPTWSLLQAKMLDIMLGIFIAIVGEKFFFPRKLNQEFTQGVIAFITFLIEYSRALTQSLIDHDTAGLTIYFQKKINTKFLNTYPKWIYEVGFNPGLRAGYRFFLLHLECISDIFSSLDYLLMQQIDNLIIKPILHDLIHSMEKNQELLQVFCEYFVNKKLINITADFTSDIEELEIQLQKIVPHHLELLDLDHEHVLLTAIVSDIKDLRKLLLELVMSLPKI